MQTSPQPHHPAPFFPSSVRNFIPFLLLALTVWPNIMFTQAFRRPLHCKSSAINLSSRAPVLFRLLSNGHGGHRLAAAGHDQSVLELIQGEMRKALTKQFGDSYQNVDPMVFVSKSGHGDYQSNVAMPLAKSLKVPPKELAEKLVRNLEFDCAIGSADVSGPGFINLHLSQNFVKHRLAEKFADSSPRLAIPKTSAPQRIIVDFSSPNIAKEMHVGHLRSTIIGDSLSRLFEFLGHDVLRLNHVGDWGTQFGMLICYMRSLYPSLDETAQVNLGDLVTFYKAAKVKFDEDESFREASRLEVVKLQSGDRESIKAWKLICEKSRSEFQQIYDILGVELLERGESFYNPMLGGIVDELRKSGLAVESEGATCVFLPSKNGMEGYNSAPLIVQKSDGGFLYATTDLAAVRHRVQSEHAKRIIYVTDAGQSPHFEMVFETAKLAGFTGQRDDVNLEHVPFGLVLGEDGKKIKTRAGDSVKLKELLGEAVKMAEEAFVERSQDSSKSPLSDDTKSKAKILGIAAVKYADLSMNRESNYRFSFSKMLSLNGNTAPYMLYAFVRIEGIKRKALSEFKLDLKELQEIMSAESISLSQPEELALAKSILKCDEVLLEVEKQLYPHKVIFTLFVSKIKLTYSFLLNLAM